MHIPDAVLDPKVAAVTGAIGAAGLAVGLRSLRNRLGERATVLSGVMAAFIFAAQMVKFWVGPGVSGHLLGGTLAAILLGPWTGAVVIAAVLIVQCFLYGDGGVTALGANFVNMGLIGSVIGYAIYAPIRRTIGGRAGIVLGGMIAAWFSVILAAGVFAIELAASGHFADFPRVLGWMTLVHAAIGVGEALITGLVLRSLLLTRPDLVEPVDTTASASASAGRWAQTALAGLAISLAVAIFLAPFAWETPDGLESVGARIGFMKEGTPSVIQAPIEDYQVPILGGDRIPRIATAVAGAIGTLVVFGVGMGLAWTMSATARSRERVTADAA
jgi:cobalt/nickel transport system permease protein